MLLFEMLTGLPPWYTQDRKKLYERIRSAPLEFPPYVRDGARDMVMCLLQRDPAKRLGSASDLKEVRTHPFFASVDWRALERQDLPTPFAPRLASDLDTRYFDKQFTRMDVEAVLAGSGSVHAPAPGSSKGGDGVEEGSGRDFRGFSFAASGMGGVSGDESDGGGSAGGSGLHAHGSYEAAPRSGSGRSGSVDVLGLG